MLDSNSAVPDFLATVKAVNIAATLRYAPATNVLLTGYADVAGPVLNNYELAERRVGRVRRLLIMRGVEPARINTVVHGQTNQFSLFEEVEQPGLNRRVQVEMLPNADER